MRVTLAFIASRFYSSRKYDVKPENPPTMLGGAGQKSPQVVCGLFLFGLVNVYGARHIMVHDKNHILRLSTRGDPRPTRFTSFNRTRHSERGIPRTARSQWQGHRAQRPLLQTPMLGERAQSQPPGSRRRSAAVARRPRQRPTLRSTRGKSRFTCHRRRPSKARGAAIGTQT